VSDNLVYPEQIDDLFGWSLGTAARMARRKKLPHYLLPDGGVRFRREEVEALIRHVPLQGQQLPEPSCHK
jgi:hypothetical protein